jgi:Uma2 family endonuclease
MQTTVAIENVIQEKPNQIPQAVHYPESDGKPMGETGFHVAAILSLLATLRAFFRNTPDLYAGANMLFYYEEGDPTVYKVPDVFVAKGVAKHERRTYKLWEEKVSPNVIFEITSRSTRWEDTGEKKGLYAELGVREYFLFDPQGEYLKPRLQGFHLTQDGYHSIPLAKDGTLTSQELGLILRPDGNLLRLVDPATGEPVPTLDEALEQKDEAQARAEAAEAESARLRDEIERLKRLAGLN